LGAIFEVLLAWIFAPFGWRIFLGISAIPSGLTLAIFWFYLPESPRYLMKKGKYKAVEVSLLSVYRTSNCRTGIISQRLNRTVMKGEKYMEEEMEAIILALSNGNEPTADSRLSPSLEFHEDENPASTTDEEGPESNALEAIRLLFAPDLKKTSAILCALYFLMAFQYYSLVMITVAAMETDASVDELQDQGTVNPEMQLEYAGIFFANLAELPGLVFAMVLLDLIGRKNTLTFLFTGSALLVPMLILKPSLLKRILIIFGCRALALGFNQSLWIYTTEVYPTRLRSTALGFTSAFARIGAVFAPFFLLFFTDDISGIFLFTFSAISLFSALLAFWLPIETKSLILV